MTEGLIPHDWSDEILDEVFRHAEVGFVLIDLHGTILQANEAFCRILGCEESKIAAASILDLVHQEEVHETRHLFERLVAGEISTYRVDRRYKTTDDKVVMAKVVASVVRSSEGELICAIELVEDIGPRLAAEEELRKSELRYRRIVEDQGEHIVRWKPDGTRTFVNKAYSDYFGNSRDELIGTSFLPSIPRKEDREAVRQKIEAFTPDKPVATSTHQIVTADGRTIWQEWTDRAFFDEKGNLAEIQSVGRDITARHLATEALHESERRYKRLFSDLPVASWQSDWTEVVNLIRNHNLRTKEEFIARATQDAAFIKELTARVQVVDANPLALELYGVSNLDEYRKWQPDAWNLVGNLDVLKAAGSIIFEAAEVSILEVTVKTRNGQQVDALVRWSRLDTIDSEWHIVGSGLDVTELRTTQRDLERQKRIFEQAERIAHIGSWEWSAEEGLAYGSEEFWNIVDGGSNTAGARPAGAFFNRVHPDDAAAFLQRAQDRASDKKTSYSPLELRIVRPDGSIRITQGRGFFRNNAEGKVVHGFGIMRDITEQRAEEAAAERQRQQLIRADRLISLGTLVGGVAHEVNNPNQFIMLNTPLLQKAWDDILPIIDEAAKDNQDLSVGGLPWSEMRDEVSEISNDILQGAERINSIVSELKGFAREGTSSSDDLVDVNEVVRTAHRLVAARIRRNAGAFHTNLASNLPEVRGNKQRLEQVVINLLLNSSDAVAESRGDISALTRFDETHSHIVLEIHDEGSGIEADVLERVFDPFYTTKRTEGGTGLGLAISSRIVSEHGGQISFKSEPGSGTTAYVRLPIGDGM